MHSTMKLSLNPLLKYMFLGSLMMCGLVSTTMIEGPNYQDNQGTSITTTDILPVDYMTNMSFQNWPNSFLTSRVLYPQTRDLGKITLDLPIEVTTQETFLETNITLSNIRLSDVISRVETFPLAASASSSQKYAMYFQEFTVPSNCYVSNVSLFMQTLVDTAQNCTIGIYKATAGLENVASVGTIIPGTSVTFDPSLEGTTTPKQAHWETITTIPHVLLDVSTTAFINGGYSFFIGVTMPKENGYYWFNCPDDQGEAANSGAAYNAKYQANAPRAFSQVMSVDFTLILGLSPENNIPLPSQASLKIDGEDVQDLAPGFGRYFSTDARVPSDGKISYVATCSWAKLHARAASFYVSLDFKAPANIASE
nr:hypothetical protein [Candidatus Sigynarchaeota archaeon]